MARIPGVCGGSWEGQEGLASRLPEAPAACARTGRLAVLRLLRFPDHLAADGHDGVNCARSRAAGFLEVPALAPQRSGQHFHWEFVRPGQSPVPTVAAAVAGRSGLCTGGAACAPGAERGGRLAGLPRPARNNPPLFALGRGLPWGSRPVLSGRLSSHFSQLDFQVWPQNKEEMQTAVVCLLGMKSWLL